MYLGVIFIPDTLDHIQRVQRRVRYLIVIAPPVYIFRNRSVNRSTPGTNSSPTSSQPTTPPCSALDTELSMFVDIQSSLFNLTVFNLRVCLG